LKILNREKSIDIEELQKLELIENLFDYSTCKDKIYKFWKNENDIIFYE